MDLAVLLLSLAALIGSARLLGEFAQRLHQPAILGELLAGVLLGPTVLGHLAPEFQAWLFPTSGPNFVVLSGIGTLAIVLFMLAAGLEVDLSVVWKQGTVALKIGTLGIVIPFVSGLVAAWFAPQLLGADPHAHRGIFALFIATAMSISALPMIARTLIDLNLYRTDLGMIIVSAAIFNDLMGWTSFAVILSLLGAGATPWGVTLTVIATLALVVVCLTVGRWVLHRTLPLVNAYSHWPSGPLGFVVVLGLVGGSIAELAGVHAIFGAFLIGAATGASPHLQERTRVMLEEFVSFVFAPVFFASIGLRLDFWANFDGQLVIVVLGLACVGKILGGVVGARWGGLSTRDRWAVGFALNARGAMEIILGLLALEAGVIRQPLFVALVIMAIATSIACGPLIRYVTRLKTGRQLTATVSPKLYAPQMQATTSREAIAELSALAAQHLPLSADSVEDLAWRREQLTATGIGHGIAIPHARTPAVSQIAAVLGRSQAGIDFDAPDGQLAHLIILLITPLDQPNQQLEVSADIARMFRDPHAIDRVLRANTYVELLAVLKTLGASGHR